jgi:hypothetical protein
MASYADEDRVDEEKAAGFSEKDLAVVVMISAWVPKKAAAAESQRDAMPMKDKKRAELW